MSVWTERNARLRECSEQVWLYLFAEQMPDSIKVSWVPHLGKNAGQATIGAIHSGGVIQLDWGYLRRHPSPLSILVHECFHSRGFTRHDKRFRQHVNDGLAKLGLPPEQ